MSDPKLDILRRSHEALLAYEKNRAKRRPRTPEEHEPMLRVLRAHRETWFAAGGKERDFLLDPMIHDLDPAAAPQTAPAEEQAKGRKGGKAK